MHNKGGIYKPLGVDWRASMEFGVIRDQGLGLHGVEIKAPLPLVETSLWWRLEVGRLVRNQGLEL